MLKCFSQCCCRLDPRLQRDIRQFSVGSPERMKTRSNDSVFSCRIIRHNARTGRRLGNFENFTIYTGEVNSFVPAAFIPALAAIESLFEGVLGLTMLVGAFLRVTLPASSVLLFLFGIAMTLSLGITSQFAFAVFVLATGTWVLAILGASLASIDALMVRLGYKGQHSKRVAHQ